MHTWPHIRTHPVRKDANIAGPRIQKRNMQPTFQLLASEQKLAALASALAKPALTQHRY